MSDKQLDDLTKSIKKLLNTENKAFLNEMGGNAAKAGAVAYHTAFNNAQGWQGRNYLASPRRKQGSFGQVVAMAWSLSEYNAKGATISNDAPYYRSKLEDRIIRPLNAKALTIPLIAEAYGRRASEYQQATGLALFAIKGTLFHKIGNQLTPVYLLRKSVSQKAWAGALPDIDVLKEDYADGWKEGLAYLIENM